MIVRIQIIKIMPDGSRCVAYKWAIFSVNKKQSFLDIYSGLKNGTLSCGEIYDLSWSDDDSLKTYTLNAKVAPAFEQMEMTPSILSPDDVNTPHDGFFIVFECNVQKVENNENRTDVEMQEVSPPKPSVVDVLMRRKESYPSTKCCSANPAGDVLQYNALVSYLKEKKFGVSAHHITEYETFINLLSDIVWNIDPHHENLVTRGYSFKKASQFLLGFNDPKKHKHSVGKFNSVYFQNKISRIVPLLERGFMKSSHLTPLRQMVLDIFEKVAKYADYCTKQNERVQTCHKASDSADDSLDINYYMVHKLKQCTVANSTCPTLKEISTALQEPDIYVPIHINSYFDSAPNRWTLVRAINDLKENGLPVLLKNYDLFCYSLPSKGCHASQHFIWKQPPDDSIAEQQRLIDEIRSSKKVYYSRSTKREIKKKLRRLGVVKPHIAEFLMKNIYGDASAPNDSNQKEVLSRFDAYVSTGDDIAVDLRANNGQVPKYEDFWEIVAAHIEDKTAVDDRRHASSTSEGDVVVSMALALSYADLYRTCKGIAESSDKEISVPSYPWFLLQFWPTTTTKSRIVKYTGRFKVKRMVQSRVLRKENPDFHYTNAIYSFLKSRAQSNYDSCVLVSADAKCKVTLGEPGYPIASIYRGKQIIVGSNEKFQVGDHDFSKISLIPDAILLQDIPKQNNVESGEENDVEEGRSDQSWYRGQVYYAIKSMVTEGSTAWRCMVELGNVLQQHYAKVPPSVYVYSDGGGDRRMTFLQVQLATIGLFFVNDLDEVVIARTAAGCSFRNPVERCHCVANLGLQGVGLMRDQMPPDMERIMSTCSSNADIRNKCDGNAKFEHAVIDSVEPMIKCLEEVLMRLSLKEKPFKIYKAALDDEIERYKKTVADKFETMPSSSDDPIVKDFYEKHCIKRTYFFQVKKCDDVQCPFHQPITTGNRIDDFPDPIPYDDNGVERYKEGTDNEEKFLPSMLQDASKRPHNIPFAPTGQTAKAGGLTIRCVECKKTRVIHSKLKLKTGESEKLKRALSGLQYICGSTFNEFDSEKDDGILKKTFVRENLSCSTGIELTYYSATIYPDVCIHCGSKRNLVPNNVAVFPRCRSVECNKKGDVARRKRKAVTVEDLGGKKKK